MVRNMQPFDLDQVVEIETLSFPTPWSREIFKREIERSFDDLYLVAVADERVVGYTGILKILDVGHITTLAVRPDFRKKGVATKLLYELISKTRLLGMRYVTLEVRESNEVAQNLYRKFGFTEMGKRKGYYIDNREDAVIMWSGDIQNEGYEKVIGMIEESMRVDC